MSAFSGKSAREELLEIDDRRKSLEDEAQAIEEFLTSPGPNGEPCAGIKAPLVDAEGFPRGDIDLFEVRRKRQRLACIRTDHSELMKRVEKLLHNLHSEQSASASPPAPHPTADAHSSTDHRAAVPANGAVSHDVMSPFAVVNEVAVGSPAWNGGLRQGDLVVRFGDARADNHRQLAAIADIVRAKQGTGIDVAVVRNQESMSMQVTPGPWSGRGLLGCHILPYP